MLTLRSQAGAALATERAPLPAGRHLARFATEFFPSLAEQAEFLGSIEAVAPAAISAVALKQQGQLLTTFPVVEAQ